MGNMTAIEAKSFVPSRDFELAKRFYQDLGFTIAWSSDDLAYIHHGNASFLLQRYYDTALDGHIMMHLLVEDVDAWWDHVVARDIVAQYQVKLVEPPSDKPWGLRDFPISDPSGVLWRIGQNI